MSKLHFWDDNWLGYVILDKIGLPLLTQNNLLAKIIDVFINGSWNLSPNFQATFPEICLDIRSLKFSHAADDVFVYRGSSDGFLFCKAAYDLYRVSSQKVAWGKDLWRHYLPPSRSFLVWRALFFKLPTDDVLTSRGMTMVSRCHFCASHLESMDHIFSQCHYVVVIWSSLASLFNVQLDITHGFYNLFNSAWCLQFAPQIKVLWWAGFLASI